MNKKVLFSISLIAIVAVGAAAGTFAFFTATRTIQEAGFITGTLDLDVRSGEVPLESFLLENLGGDYTMSGSKEWVVRNTGTIPGRLFVRLENIQNINNGCNDPKMIARGSETIEACEEELGMLGQYITLVLELDGEEMARSTLATADIDSIRDQWQALIPVIFQSEEERVLRASWSADPTEYGNEIQSDEVRFDIRFNFTQLLEDEFVPGA